MDPESGFPLAHIWESVNKFGWVSVLFNKKLCTVLNNLVSKSVSADTTGKAVTVVPHHGLVRSKCLRSACNLDYGLNHGLVSIFLNVLVLCRPIPLFYFEKPGN